MALDGIFAGFSILDSTLRTTMRKEFEQQFTLGIEPICEVKISSKSRHELPALVAGLQHIFCNTELNSAVFDVISQCLYGDEQGKKAKGRPGMSLWEIFVLGVVRLGTNTDWDALLHMANYDRLLRGILGVNENVYCAARKEYSRQTLIDNVSLLDEATIVQINDLIVLEGHRVLKKKEGRGLEVKADTFVLESNTHYPTDTGLLWDSIRKCMDTMTYVSKNYSLEGWRKTMDWKRRVKIQERKVSMAFRARGENKTKRVAEEGAEYIKLVESLAVKLAASLPAVKELFQTEKVPNKYHRIFYFHETMLMLLDQIRRRLIDGEKIPHEQKIFSIFEPWVEWISKGKAGKRVEFGRKILIATDEFGLILYHKVITKTDDRDLAIIFTTELMRKHKISSLSLDKGFYSKKNKEALEKMVPVLVMPKKGTLTKKDQIEEGKKQFKMLRNKHSAVESNINQLEHNGLDRCPDRGLDAFERYTALGVLSYNIHRVGTELMEQKRKQAKAQKARLRAA
jgi:hypothetical protein